MGEKEKGKNYSVSGREGEEGVWCVALLLGITFLLEKSRLQYNVDVPKGRT